MEILIGSPGFCLGITRAYRKMHERARNEPNFAVTHQNAGGEFDTLSRIERREKELLAQYPALGEVPVVRDLSTLGPGDRLVLGFHGLTKDTRQALAAQHVDVVEDLTCPFIAKLDKMVERLARDGFDIAIVGARDNHHCRVAAKVAAEHDRHCFVIERPEEIDAVAVQQDPPVALVGQVTGNTRIFTEVIERIRAAKAPIKVVKTMCSDSYGRQQAALELAERADLVILMDDGGGAAQSLFEVCSSSHKRVRRVRRKQEIKPDWFDGVQRAAVVGGILVPSWAIAETAHYIETITRVVCSSHEAAGKPRPLNGRNQGISRRGPDRPKPRK